MSDQRCGGEPGVRGLLKACRQCTEVMAGPEVACSCKYCTGCPDCVGPELSGAVYQQACDFVAQLKQASYEWDLSDGEEAANMAAELAHFLDAALREAEERGEGIGKEAWELQCDLQAAAEHRADKAEAEASYLRDCNDVLQTACEVDAQRRDKAEAEVERLKQAANWVLNCASGIGTCGGKPEPGEEVAALNSLRAALEGKP